MKNKKPFISVIIPVYNEEKYLNFCLSSIINQTYKNFEIVVVDDGSTDKSLEIAKKFKVRFFKTEHKGAGFARNFGVSKANGKILVFADADMVFDKNYIKNLVKPILDGKAVGTFTKEEFVANPKNIWSRCWSINNGVSENRRLPLNYPNTENAFRAILNDLFVKGGGFETNDGYSDDSSLSRKLKIKAVSASGAICYHYNPSTLKQVFYSSRWIGRSRLFKPTIANFLRFSLPNSLRVGFKYFLIGAPVYIIFFKIIYDIGMFSGIFLRTGKTFK